MPADRESDDTDEITVGSYVYSMDVDEDMPRGELGVVVEVLSASQKRIVEFPSSYKFSLLASKLNVSDFQKGTFVHAVDDDELGIIQGLEEGNLLNVAVKGEERKEKPDRFIRCDIQPGMYVFWSQANADVARGQVGEVLPEVNDEGKVKVAFPRGISWLPAMDLIRADIQAGNYVCRKSPSDDSEEVELGQIVGGLEDGKLKVQFATGEGNFKLSDLICHEMQRGSFVTWTKSDEDIPEGHLGYVVDIRVKKNRLRVKFLSDTWNMKPSDLALHRLQPGRYVLWEKADQDIPRGDIGEVVRLHDAKNMIRVQWPRGGWSIPPHRLAVLPFQKGDSVQWKKSDKDVVEGEVGKVMWVRQDKSNSGDRLFVKFSKGRWAFEPDSLKQCNMNVATLMRVKSTFRRFDRNGDGKLSQEELVAILLQLKGEEPMNDEDYKLLFNSMDKDSDGKVSVQEFLDYIFAEAEPSQSKMLLDGFGQTGLIGFTGEEDEDPDLELHQDIKQEPQVPSEPLQARPSLVVPSIDSERYDEKVSREDWACAMLALGVCRQAALDSYDACQMERPSIRDLASKLNGSGASPEAEDLLAVLQRVKDGALSAVDLSVPDEEVSEERNLAKQTGIEGLLFHLHVQDKPPAAAPDELFAAKLSALELKVLSALTPEELTEAVAAASRSASSLSAVNSWQRARENCSRQVKEIVDSCKSNGEKYTDKSFDVLGDEKAVIFVDKEKRGYGCGMTPPTGWKRASELQADGKLFVDGCEANDINQGRIGDCYLLGSLGTMVGNRKAFLQQVFVAHDWEVGVYGVLFYSEGHFTYTIVDDYLAVDDGGQLLYGKSSSKDEFWVSILEKAFAKHLTCLEQIDGGQPEEAIYSLLGGVNGIYTIRPDRGNPPSFFQKMMHACNCGELLTVVFVCPHSAWSKFGNLGIQYMDRSTWDKLGLQYSHCYSVLRVAEVDGQQLICFRNPWGHGEWKGRWSDASEEWTEELREKLGAKKGDNGQFWMAVEDYVELSQELRFCRTFGPTWQCATQYGRFQEGNITVRAKKDYQKRGGDEMSHKKGDLIEPVGIMQGMFCKGVNLTSGDAGMFLTKNVDLQCMDVFACELSLADVAADAPVILTVMRQNRKTCREFKGGKDGGPNRALNDYHWIHTFVFNCDGERVWKENIYMRSMFTTLDPSKAPYTVYMTCPNGGKRFALCAFAPHGALCLAKKDCTYRQFLDVIYA
ncbi:CalpB [Symbiodinium sp. CCMP2592]|nr:CalpB [Symbiodinium sp. CCMP2592]